MSAPVSRAVPDRRAGIGASEVPALLGLSPYKTRGELYLEKIGTLPAEVEPSVAMKTGTALEGFVVNLAGEELGLRFRRNHKPRLHPIVPLFATPDALCGTIGLEAKVGHNPWTELPDAVKWQAVAQMAVWPRFSEVVVARLATVNGGSLQMYTVPRDEDEIAFVVRQVQAFWYDHVLPRIQPVDTITFRTKAGLTATEEQEAIYAELAEVRAAKLAVEAEEAELRARLMATTEPGTTISSPKGWSAAWSERRTTSWKRACEHAGVSSEIIEACTEAAPIFTVRGPRER